MRKEQKKNVHETLYHTNLVAKNIKTRQKQKQDQERSIEMMLGRRWTDSSFIL